MRDIVSKLYQRIRSLNPARRESSPHLATSVDPRETDLAHRNGYAPFPVVLIVSTERSGLNLIRHAVEYAGQRRTPGKTHLLKSGPLAFHRTHWVNTSTISPGRTPVLNQDGDPLYSKLILLLRDPREILPRAYANNLERMSDYCDNLRAFHDFQGEKLLVAYDDLMRDDSLFRDIFLFLNLDVELSLDHVPEIRSTSVAWYQANQAKGGGSQTQGSLDALRQHQQNLSSEELTALRDLLDQQLGPLVPVYLSRWLS